MENQKIKYEKILRETVLGYNQKKLTKSYCKYYDVGNCEKFHKRCFDCKEYRKSIDYLV